MRMKKKRRIRKVIACVLTLLLIASSLPISMFSNAVQVNATEGTYTVGGSTFTYTVTESDTVTITGWTGTDTDVVIPDEIDGKAVTVIDNNTFYTHMLGTNKIKTLQLPVGLQSITGDALWYLGELEAIIISEESTGYKTVDGVLYSTLADPAKALLYYPTAKKDKKYEVLEGTNTIYDKAFYSMYGISALEEVVIPESVKYIGSSAFGILTDSSLGKYESNLKKVNIPSGVTIINYGTFSGCEKLEDITIPDGVGSIEAAAFAGCKSLTRIDIPSSVGNIGLRAFAGCDTLESINVAEGNSNFVSVGGVLYNGDKSELIKCPAAKTGEYNIPDTTITIHESAFEGCKKIAAITIPTSVTSIGANTFSECQGLADIVVPEGVTSLEYYMFYGCENLVSVKLPAELTSIGSGAFAGCKSLKNIDIPSAVTVIESDAFGCCTSLESVELPEKLVVLGQFAFSECTSLKSVKMPETLSYINSGVFSKCSELSEIILPKTLTSIGASAFSGCVSLKSIDIPDGVTEIGSNSFSGCISIEKVTLPDTLTNIYGSAFYECTSLKSIDIPDGVIEIGMGAFERCTSLSDVKLSSKLEIIGGATFRYCENLTSISIPESVTSIGMNVFYDCVGLKSINVAAGNINYSSDNGVLYDTVNSKLMAYPSGSELSEYSIKEGTQSVHTNAFYNTPNLKNVYIPASVSGDVRFSYNSLEYIDVSDDNEEYKEVDGVLYSKDGLTIRAYPMCKSASYEVIKGTQSVGDYAFCYNDKLVSVTLPDSIATIGRFAFIDNKALESVNIPEGVTTIGRGVFSSCSKLSEITIPNSVTTIDRNAFSDCDSLTEIVIPDSVTTMGTYVLQECDGLTEIVIPKSVTTVDISLFYGCENLESVIISKGVTSITGYPYAQSPNLTIYYYEGTDYSNIMSYGYSIDEFDFKFIKLEETTSDDNIIVDLPTSDAGTTITVETEKLSAEDEAYKKIVIDDIILSDDIKPEDVKFTAYDITLKDNKGVTVQPDGNVVVKLPVPDGYNGSNCKVYHVDDNGKLTDMAAKFVDGLIVFITDHFSTYMITETELKASSKNEPTVAYGDVNSDGDINSKDVVAMKKYIVGYTVEGIDLDACDVNEDGTINSKDVVMVMKHIVGYDVTFGAQ